MPYTRIQDVIQPEIFTDYTIKRTMELSALIQSGIAENNKDFDRRASESNTLINMPFWNDLDGDPEIMDDNSNTTPGKIEAGQDLARKIAFVKSFGANALSSVLSGSDPMKVIADRFGAYWTRQYQKALLSILDGIFAATSMEEKVLDITANTVDTINGRTFLDAVQLMGDAKDELTGVMMHSATETYLAKNDLIDYKEDSQGKVRIPYFMGKRVIVDDSIAFDTETGASEAYLFGNGAIAWGNGSHENFLQTEVVRNGLSKAGEDVLVNRRYSILHPRGVKWTEQKVTNNQFPSFEDLADGSNWERVYDPKAIKIVKFIFKTE